MRIDPASTRPTYTTFAGEGVVKTLAQGVDAYSGVAAHEAANLRVFEAQANRNDQEIVSKDIEIKLAYNPQTHRLEVVGGRSHVSFHDKEDPARPAGEEDPAEAEGATSFGDGALEIAAEDEDTEQARILEDLSTALKSQLQTLDTKIETERENPEKVARIKDKKVELKQQIEDLEAQRRQLQVEKAVKAVNETVGGAIEQSNADALGLAKQAHAGKQGDDDEDPMKKAMRKPGRGMFTPSYTTAGFFINTSG